ncbi:hypothetical protein PFISCL1PPCAC_15219 [Pristionchus fissidentatus]|uniref:39S ribosomal protein L46, mitochondrial n=1 Tax=Pristionchus fissidentatus TaxID=1538716 RepID=A0AAV5W1B3_9BILA|nr:hypothetical protein PFISCL1PPCAC_15219 [Pristionchus fissidentatus]
MAAKWDVMVSLLLTRRPTIAPPMTALEQNFQRLSLKREDDKSLLSDFELKSKKDELLEARRARLLEEGKDLSELEGELGETNAMRIDDWTKRETTLTQALGLSSPSPSPPSSSPSSLSRLLDRRLTLLVQHRFGRDSYASPWILPQMANRKGESLAETADRCLSSLLPGLTGVSFHNAPFAVHTQRYPKGLRQSMKTDAIGAKLFFYSADITVPKSGEITLNKDEIASHSWLTREEIVVAMAGRPDYKKKITASIVE